MSVAVYTFSDAAGEALYVGMSNSVPRRLLEHHRRPWWPDVATVCLEHFATRDDARSRERALIAALAPPHNLSDTQALSGDALRAARLRAGKSVEDVAVAAGVCVGTVERAELGKTTPRRATLKVITDALGLDAEPTGAAA